VNPLDRTPPDASADNPGEAIAAIDPIQKMRAAEALQTLRWAFESIEFMPLRVRYARRSLSLSSKGVLTVTDNHTGQILAVSAPDMVCELDPAFVPPASFAEELD